MMIKDEQISETIRDIYYEKWNIVKFFRVQSTGVWRITLVFLIVEKFEFSVKWGGRNKLQMKDL